MSKILAVVGFISSGKNTVADFFIEKGFLQESFAKSLKESVASIFNWDIELLSGKTHESREWREKEDAWWANRLNMPGLTPRNVLQTFGTELFRNNYHSDIWLASLEARIKNSDRDVIISDCRFNNEFNAIKQLNGQVIWVQRGPLPIWYNSAINDLQKLENIEDPANFCGEMHKKYPNIHRSEWSWLNNKFDYIIENNLGINELNNSLDNLWQRIDR